MKFSKKQCYFLLIAAISVLILVSFAAAVSPVIPKLFVESSVTVDEGETRELPIFIANDGSVFLKEQSFEVSVAPITNQSAVSAEIIAESLHIVLAPGEEARFPMRIEVSENARELLENEAIPAFSVIVSANGELYASKAFIVEVKKEGVLQRLFDFLRSQWF